MERIYTVYMTGNKLSASPPKRKINVWRNLNLAVKLVGYDGVIETRTGKILLATIVPSDSIEGSVAPDQTIYNISYELDATRGLIASYAAPLLPRKHCQLCSTTVAFRLDCVSLKSGSGPPGKDSSLQILIANPNAANEVMMSRVKILPPTL